MELNEIKEKLVGLTLDEAEELLKDSGYHIRVRRQDGAYLVRTDDLNLKRINVHIIGMKIKLVTGIG